MKLFVFEHVKLTCPKKKSVVQLLRINQVSNYSYLFDKKNYIINSKNKINTKETTKLNKILHCIYIMNWQFMNCSTDYKYERDYNKGMFHG
jgi:hypothetical protein